MSLIQGLNAIRGYGLGIAPVGINTGEQQAVKRNPFMQNAIAQEYSLAFPKADNSVPYGDSHLGQKLPRLYA